MFEGTHLAAPGIILNLVDNELNNSHKKQMIALEEEIGWWQWR